MTRPASASGFAVEIFVKQHEIAPVGIIRVFPNVAMTRSGAILVRQEDTSEPAGKLTRDLLKGHHVSRAGRAFDLERFTVEQVITFQRFDHQEVNRKPNRTAPIRITTKKIAVP